MSSRSPHAIVQTEEHQAEELVVIVRAVQTGVECPSQWDAWDDQGRYFYLRWRHGRGSVDTFDDPDPETWGNPPFGVVAHFSGALEGEGREELENFCRQAGITLSPDAETYMWRAPW